MNRLVYSPRSAQDLDDIFTTIAAHNPTAAARMIQTLEQACDNLAQQPGIGAPCDQWRPGMRYLARKGYVIFYRCINTTVEIVRIVHGARDVSALFTP